MVMGGHAARRRAGDASASAVGLTRRCRALLGRRRRGSTVPPDRLSTSGRLRKAPTLRLVALTVAAVLASTALMGVLPADAATSTTQVPANWYWQFDPVNNHSYGPSVAANPSLDQSSLDQYGYMLKWECSGGGDDSRTYGAGTPITTWSVAPQCGWSYAFLQLWTLNSHGNTDTMLLDLSGPISPDGTTIPTTSVTTTVDCSTDPTNDACQPGGASDSSNCGFWHPFDCIKEALSWAFVPDSGTMTSWQADVTTLQTHLPVSLLVSGIPYVTGLVGTLAGVNTTVSDGNGCAGSGQTCIPYMGQPDTSSVPGVAHLDILQGAGDWMQNNSWGHGLFVLAEIALWAGAVFTCWRMVEAGFGGKS